MGAYCGSNKSQRRAQRYMLSTDRPIRATRRPVDSATRNSVCRRAILLAKQLTTTLPVKGAMVCNKPSATSPSFGEKPSRVALVESQITASMPPLTSRTQSLGAQGSPTTGRWSIFQSAVCKIRLEPARNNNAQVSAVECVSGNQSISKSPTLIVLPGVTSIRGWGRVPRPPATLRRSTSAAKGVA